MQQKIKEILNNMGITQTKIAKTSALSRATVSRTINGKTANPTTQKKIYEATKLQETITFPEFRSLLLLSLSIIILLAGCSPVPA